MLAQQPAAVCTSSTHVDDGVAGLDVGSHNLGLRAGGHNGDGLAVVLDLLAAGGRQHAGVGALEATRGEPLEQAWAPYSASRAKGRPGWLASRGGATALLSLLSAPHLEVKAQVGGQHSAILGVGGKHLGVGHEVVEQDGLRGKG